MAETRGVTRRDLFRMAAAGGVTTAVGLNWGGGGPSAAAAADTSTPDGALQALLDGNDRFLAGNMTSFDADLSLIRMRAAHEPFAAILSCADARVPPEIVFDQVMGDLFVTRVAGNITTPEIIASLEYAALAGPPGLNVRLIMVLGHGSCGAVTETNKRTAAPGQISALYAPLRPAVNIGGISASVDEKSQLNARIQAILLQDSSPLIASRVQAGTLRVVAAFVNLVRGDPKNGAVTILPTPPLTPPGP